MRILLLVSERYRQFDSIRLYQSKGRCTRLFALQLKRSRLFFLRLPLFLLLLSRVLRVPHRLVVERFHRGPDLGIVPSRRRQEVVRQGPDRVRLEALDFGRIRLAAALLELGPDRPSERRRLGVGRSARRHVPDQTQAIPIQLRQAR